MNIEKAPELEVNTGELVPDKVPQKQEKRSLSSTLGQVNCWELKEEHICCLLSVCECSHWIDCLKTVEKRVLEGILAISACVVLHRQFVECLKSSSKLMGQSVVLCL